MLKIINKDLYWNMNDENYCINDVMKLADFFNKTKNATMVFDKIINKLFNTEQETINYLLTEKKAKTSEAIAITVQRKKENNKYFPINNSYFIDVNEKTCKKVDLKNNNVVVFLTQITTNTNIEVYLSETNISKYNHKVNKVVPVVVFKLPEYAQEKIYNLFYKSFYKLFLNIKCKTPYVHPTHKPIVNSKRRKMIICKYANISEEHYDKWQNGEEDW